MTNNTQPKGVHWKELDVLRGLAALFMIVNHVGVNTLAPHQFDGRFVGSLLFITSFAPVLYWCCCYVLQGVHRNPSVASSFWFINGWRTTSDR
jgi:uncharacterized membrane protein